MIPLGWFLGFPWETTQTWPLALSKREEQDIKSLLKEQYTLRHQGYKGDTCFQQSHHQNGNHLPKKPAGTLIVAAAAKSLQLCLTLCDPIDEPTRLPRPWDSPGKNTGVGCHVLLQCMKVKSKREVTQLCPTLSDSMDCSLPGSCVHGIFQARVLEWGNSHEFAIVS